ncbi:sporulation protein [Streptomyces sp. SBT349]|uniref:sporulation protein n=1 Tax=Streptomyces sp. SBT349 TaxID=1580539 RepID=UPI00066C3F13|nr:sporulation protein [Streptomyces sp. SBT349]
MVCERRLGPFGVGGPTAETVLDGGSVPPGGTLAGEVRLRGGGADVEIEEVTLELVAGVAGNDAPFARFRVGGGFPLAAGERRAVPFAVALPWETPVTELHGQPLGVPLGVRTGLGAAGASDTGGLDPLAVAPLPAQDAVLRALGRLGFGFLSASLEPGRLAGTGQQLPFRQEFGLIPPEHYAEGVREVGLTFLAGTGGVEVVLGTGDAPDRHAVGHDSVGRTDWTAEVDAWVRGLLERHRSGLGLGAALAAGVVGGLVAAEVMEDLGDAPEAGPAAEGGGRHGRRRGGGAD